MQEYKFRSKDKQQKEYYMCLTVNYAQLSARPNWFQRKATNFTIQIASGFVVVIGLLAMAI